MPETTRRLLVVVLVVALVGTTTGLVLQWRRATAAEDRIAELTTRIDELRTRVAELEDDDGAGQDDDGGGSADGDGGAQGLMGELLGGSVPGAACLGAGAATGGGETRELPDDPAELVEVVGEQVAELRGLEWERDVEVDFLDGDELGDRLEEMSDEDLAPDLVEAEQRLLAALGAVPEDLDLEAVQRQLLDEQVAGYYDPETGELVVRVPDDGQPGPMDAITLAHELQHALGDQAVGLPDLEAERFTEDADAQLGAVALVEGDASLLMNHWTLRHLSITDQLGGMLGGAEMDAAAASLASVPHYLQQELVFPYLDGLDYVCELYREGGWEAVDARYDDPPATSVEVLHPERDGEEPAEPGPLVAPEGGRELVTTTFGAAPLQWLLEAPGGEVDRAVDDAEARAAAWDGGRVGVWDLDGDTVVGLSLVDRGDGPPLCETVAAWHRATWPQDEAAVDDDGGLFRGADASARLVCEDDEVRYARAPDVATAVVVSGAG